MRCPGSCAEVADRLADGEAEADVAIAEGTQHFRRSPLSEPAEGDDGLAPHLHVGVVGQAGEPWDHRARQFGLHHGEAVVQALIVEDFAGPLPDGGACLLQDEAERGNRLLAEFAERGHRAVGNRFVFLKQGSDPSGGGPPMPRQQLAAVRAVYHPLLEQLNDLRHQRLGRVAEITQALHGGVARAPRS